MNSNPTLELCNTNKESEFFQKNTMLPNERIDGRKSYGTSLILRSYGVPSVSNSSSSSSLSHTNKHHTPPTRFVIINQSFIIVYLFIHLVLERLLQYQPLLYFSKVMIHCPRRHGYHLFHSLLPLLLFQCSLRLHPPLHRLNMAHHIYLLLLLTILQT